MGSYVYFLRFRLKMYFFFKTFCLALTFDVLCVSGAQRRVGRVA